MVRTARDAESIFRSSEFRRYYAGQALSYLGDGLRTLVVPLLVFHLTGSAVALGLTFALEVLPFALFSPLARRPLAAAALHGRRAVVHLRRDLPRRAGVEHPLSTR